MAKQETTKEDCLEVTGEIVDALKAGFFHVKLDNNNVILAYPSGKIRKHFIKILPGDKVLVEMSVYDLTKGRITYRYK